MGAGKAASVARGGSADAAPSTPGRDRKGRNPALVAALAVTLLLSAAGLAAWIARGVLDRPLAPAPDRAELVALDQRLTRIQDTIRPIAAQFAAEPDSGLIDVGSYRAKIASARRLVDSTNDLATSGPEALEVRDLIITGGSQVLSGLDTALDALVSDNASATVPALTKVEEGLSALQDARDKLDGLLGKKSGA